MKLVRFVGMIPNVSKLSLDDDQKCVPCMTPVRLQDREQQLKDHMASFVSREDHMARFVFRETLEDQIKASICGICREPLGFNNSDAPARAAGAQNTPHYVDYCGSGHYIHKWCAHLLLAQRETTPCPDCRAQPTDNARIAIAESYPMPEAGAAAPAAAPAPAPAAAPAQATARRLPRLRAGEERMGPQRATDQLQQWSFWLKPADSAAQSRLNSEDVNERVRRTLMRYMWTNFTSPEAVTNVIRRLEVRAYPFYATFTGETQPSTNAPVLLVICKLWLPSLAANYFLNFFYAEKRRYMGTCSMMRRWLGIISADVTSPGEETVLRWYASWSHMQDRPQGRPAPPESHGPFTMRRSSYNNWRPYMLESDPLRIIPGHKGPQSATDVPIEWRLWVKGNFPDNARGVGRHVRSFLSRWFHNQGQFESQRDLDIPQRLSLTASFGIATQNAVTDMDSPINRIDCQLYMPSMTLAQDFVDACKNIGLNATTRGSQPEDGFDVIMGSIVGVSGARLASPADFFHIRMGPLRQSMRMGSCPHELVPKPNMGRREYEQWPQHTFLGLPPVIRVVEPGPSEPGPSSSAALREQARQERPEERAVDVMLAALGDGNDDDDDDDDEEMEEVIDEGTLGPSSSS